jgi:hypothetical protein
MTTSTYATEKKSNNQRTIPIALAGIAIAAGAAVYASPYWALHSLSNAVRDKDAARVAEYVDFVLLRDSVKELMSARMDAEMKTRGVPEDNPFANLAQTFVKGMLNQAVDAMVSPSGVVKLLQQQQQSPRSETPRSAPPAASPGGGSGTTDAQAGSKPRFHVDYQNYSTVHVSSEGRELGFVFRRYGLLSWKMVGLNGTLLDRP